MAYNDNTNTDLQGDPNNSTNLRKKLPTQGTDYTGYMNNSVGATAPTTGAQGMPMPQGGGWMNNTAGSPPSSGSPAPAGSYDRSAFRDAWMGSGSKTVGDLQNFVQQHQGDFGAGVQIMPGKGDKIRLPDGTYIDAVIGAGLGGQGAGWTGDPSQMGGGGGGGVGAPGGPMNNDAGGGGGGFQGAQDPMIQELLTRLKGRADQSLNVNAATDPNIRAQADPFAAAQERSRQNYLAAAAEKAGPNANMTNENRLSAEHAAQTSGGYEASLVGNEIAARRNEVQNALSSMQGLLTDEQKMGLQKELAQLDDATRRYQISSQASIANRGLDQDWQRALMGNDQFYANLGLNAENSYNNWNNQYSGG